MGSALSTLLWVLLVWALLVAVATTVAVVTLRRMNRVVPRVRSSAPLIWLVSPTRPARMHRQLRSLGTWVTHPEPKVHRQLWKDVVAEIVATDAELVVAARSNPRIRATELDAVGVRIDRLEDLAERLRNLDRFQPDGTTRQPPSDAIEVLEHRLVNLEQAHHDLVDLERRFRTGDRNSGTTTNGAGDPTSTTA